jgi:polyferredoxin
MKERKREAKLLFITILFALLVGYPFLQMAASPALIGGVPKLYAYIFFVWAILILAIILVMRTSKRKREYE